MNREGTKQTTNSHLEWDPVQAIAQSCAAMLGVRAWSLLNPTCLEKNLQMPLGHSPALSQDHSGCWHCWQAQLPSCDSTAASASSPALCSFTQHMIASSLREPFQESSYSSSFLPQLTFCQSFFRGHVLFISSHFKSSPLDLGSYLSWTVGNKIRKSPVWSQRALQFQSKVERLCDLSCWYNSIL